MRALAISAHADDETLGCGGTLLRHREQKDQIFWLILTKAHAPRWTAEVIARKEQEVTRVAQAYGVAKYFWPGFPSTCLGELPFNKVLEVIADVIREVRPEVVYTVHGGDIHSDHRVVFRACTVVMKPFHMRELGVKRLMCFETLSSTDAAVSVLSDAFLPQVFHDVTPFMPRKLEIMELFSSETHAEPLPRARSSIEALGRLRGATVGLQYAEAFMLIRELA